MTESERVIYQRLAWFPPDTTLLGKESRPLSFATWHAMKLMGVRLLDRTVKLEPAQEFAQLMVYRWLHQEPEAEISAALWNSGWREILNAGQEVDEPPLELLDQWRKEREQILNLLEATEVRLKPRKSGGKDDTPFDVVGPDEMAHRLTIVQEGTGMSDHEILWLMPLYQFHQRYHAKMRWQRFWTVRKSGPKEAVDFTGFGEGVMSNLREQDNA